MATPSGLCALSSEAIRSTFLARRKLADLLSVQNLLLFLQSCEEEFQSASPHTDSSKIWTSICQLLLGSAAAFHPLAMDAMGSAHCLRAMVHCDMFKDGSANVRHELMTAPTFSSKPVDPKKALGSEGCPASG